MNEDQWDKQNKRKTHITYTILFQKLEQILNCGAGYLVFEQNRQSKTAKEEHDEITGKLCKIS